MKYCDHIKNINYNDKANDIISDIKGYFALLYNCSLCQIDKEVYLCLEKDCDKKLCEEFKHYYEHYEEHKHPVYYNLFTGSIICLSCDITLELSFKNNEDVNIIKFKRKINKEISFKYKEMNNLQINNIIGNFKSNDSYNYVESIFLLLYSIKYIREVLITIYTNEMILFNKINKHCNSKLILLIAKIMYYIKFNKGSFVPQKVLDSFLKLYEKYFNMVTSSMLIDIYNYLMNFINNLHNKTKYLFIDPPKTNTKTINYYTNNKFSDLYIQGILKDDSIIRNVFNCNFKNTKKCLTCKSKTIENDSLISLQFNVLNKSSYINIQNLRKKLKINQEPKGFFNSYLKRII